MTAVKKFKGYINLTGWSRFMNKKLTFCLILTFLLTNFATAAALRVPQDYLTIDAAINAIILGIETETEIVVDDGNYTPLNSNGFDFGGELIWLRSKNGPQNCIINCNNAGRAFYFHNGETQAATVEGFTIKNGNAYYGGAIECEIDSSPTINNCIITNNTAAYGGAIDCFYYSSPVITNCIISNNTADYDGSAIETSSESSPVIRNCLIVNNTADGYGAIDCYDGSSPVITNCTIADNTGDANIGGIHATDISSPTIRNCILWNNGDDIYGATATYSCIQDGDVGTGNISSNPIFKRGPYPNYGNYYLSQTAAGQLPGTDSNCVNRGRGVANDDNDTNMPDADHRVTRTDNVPDTNTVDMGFHYPSGSDVNYVLVSIVDPNGNFGTIDPNYPAPGHLYKQFTEVRLHANPEPNYYLAKWTGTNDDNSTDVNNLVTMDANRTVVAKFSSTIMCSLTTFTLDSNGSIDLYNAQPFVKHSIVDINAYPVPGYVVKRWLKGNTETFNINDANTYTQSNDSNIPYRVTLLRNTTVAVEFEPNSIKHLLTPSVINSHGTIDPPRRIYYPEGMIVPLTATPDSGYRVKTWGGNVSAGDGTTRTVVMNSDKTVTVEFEVMPKYQLTININDPNMGSVEPNSGLYDANSVVTLTAIPTEGYRVKSWAGNANNKPAWNVITNTVTMDANKTVTVTFELNYSRVIHVTGDVNGIQKAIDQAQNGDTVKIPRGTYVGRGFVINKVISIVGEPDHPEDVVIDCLNEITFGFALIGDFNNPHNPCTLSGVTIINSDTTTLPAYVGPNPQPGMDGQPTQSDHTNPLVYNMENYGGGIIIAGDHIVKNCIVRDCAVRVAQANGGITGNNPDTAPEDPCDYNDPNGGDGGWGGNAGGAGIWVAWGDPNILYTLVENCTARAGDGGNGAIGVSQQDDLTDGDPCTIWYPPGASGVGGDGGDAFGAGIFVQQGSPKFTNVTVRNCIAISGKGGNGSTGEEDAGGGNGGLPGRVNGAGIYCATNSSPVFVDCLVENCSGYSGKGGDGGDGGPPNVWTNMGGYGGLTLDPGANQGDIKQYTTKGGGIFCDVNCNPTFTNCTFTGNIVYGSISGVGGRWQPSNVQVQPRKNFFLPSFGAGVFCSTASSSKFYGCRFENNRTAYNQDFNTTAFRDVIDMNEANGVTPYEGDSTGLGGGLCLWYGLTSDINECDFVLNSAPAGGGIYSEGSGIYIRDCNLTNNVSLAGGGALILDSVGTINNSIIKGNIAGTQTGYYGDSGYASFGTGGGLYMLSTMMDINDTLVTENFARLTGGGICFDGDAPFTRVPQIKNCLITANTAADEGGGIAVTLFAEPKIQNCTIAENIVTDVNSNGGGLFATYAANVKVKDTIFWGNSGINGSQIAVTNGGSVPGDMPANLIITYSDIDLRYKSAFDLTQFEPGSTTTGGSVLVDSQTIYSQINSTGSAKVIVSLFEPTEAQTINWSSPASVTSMRNQVATLQNQVLSTLNASEFTLRHKLTNVAVFSGQITQTGLNKLMANPNVAHIEPVRTLYPMTAQGIPLMNALDTRGTYNGQGVSIAIVDSGVDYTHPRLGGGAFPNSKVIGGWDFIDNDADPMPTDSAHGTSCAGIAAGSLGTVGDYIGGVAPNAKIYAIRIGDIPGFPSDYGLTAWDWCITHKNDDTANPILVISNSWRSNDWFSDTTSADALSPAYSQAAQIAVSAGITILAASGNESYANEISWPAAMSNVISVGAVYDAAFMSQTCYVQTQPDQVTCYSNTANILDIFAPSENAYTTALGGGYNQYFNGTSAACPYAAGAVAALQSAAKQLKGNYLTPFQVRGALKLTGNPITDTKVTITKPRVNLGAAIALMTESVPIYAEQDCTIIGLAQDVNGTWLINDNNNISEDPNFVLGYYLSHIATGQNTDSNCIGAGSATAASLGLNTYTTRIDGEKDAGIVDLGYHYSEGLPSYGLRIDADCNDANGTIEAPYIPGHTYYFYAGAAVRLHAIPDANARVAMWILDGVEYKIHDRYFNVLMDGPRSVVVRFEFYTPGNLTVPDEYATIQEAIDASESGDTIYVYRKPSGQSHYITDPCGLDFKGKAITIRSENPDDPNVVAQTIIDCNNRGRAFIFRNNEEANSIIEGFTIINCLAAGEIAVGVRPDPLDANTFAGIDAFGDGYGGAIYCGENTSPTIRNSIFRNCEVTGGRGSDGQKGRDFVDFATGDPNTRAVRGGRGGNGSGNGYGGVIFCNENSSPLILDCTFGNCAARGGIGGDGGNGGIGTAANPGGNGGDGGNGSGFGYGGAIYAAAGANPKIIRCNFLENTASQGLGGTGGRQGPGQTPDLPPDPRDGFTGASIGAGFAGAIYYETGTTVDINDCNFIDNTADAVTSISDAGGGAIYCEPDCAGIITILKANMAGNRSTQGSGGAIWFGAENNINLTDCYFGGNTANADGGALAIGQEADANMCILDFNNCAFTDNVAGNTGGAIIAKNFDAEFIDCYINRNSAVSGGGLYLISEKSIAKIHGGTIMQNKATGANAEGGGAFISNLPLEIINCQIIGNTSLYSGGGIMFKGPHTTTSMIHNCLLAKNSAGARGGALLVSLNSSPKITSCTFSENGTEPGGAGGAVFCSHNSSPIIKDCIFEQTKRVAIYEGSTDSDPNISYCLFYDNADGDFYDRDSGITYKTLEVSNPAINLAALNAATSGNNIAGTANNPLTPLFVTGDLGNYYLSQRAVNPSDANIHNSPAIDAGSADANKIGVLPGETMANYTTRIDSADPTVNAGDANRLDIGFHYIDIEPGRPRKFELTTAVLGTHGTIEPPSGQHYAGTTVQLTALLDPGWRVNKWTGTDDDSSTNTTNYVVMIRDRSVVLSFEQPRNLYVPGEYTSLQNAVNDAKSGDKIILSKGIYAGSESNYDPAIVIIIGKNITITSTNPDDPCIVAQTILQGNGFGFSDVDRTMVLDGITIQDAHYYAGNINCSAESAHGPTDDGINGGSIFGGAVRIINASPTIRNCRFVNCSALASNGCDGTGDSGDGGWAGFAWGGAAAIDSRSNPIFKNCQFINCYAQGSNGMNGAGRWGHGGNWGDPNDNAYHTWDFGPYEGYWFYSGYGGAIYCMGGSKPEFEKCLFQNNHAYGGVCGISGTDRVAGYPMQHYAIDSFGGAVYIAAGSEAKFTDCNFVGNEAHTRGQLGNPDANVPNIFRDEERNFVLYDPVVSYGGAVCAEGAAIPVFKNCIFTNNSACAGGAMYWEDSVAHISRCTFTNCTSMLGGAVLLTDSNSILFECDFRNNRAMDPAGQGGAIYCASSDAKFYDCEVNENQASASGGGIYFSGELEPNMHNCLITHNTAGRDGGGISTNWDAQLTLSNCTIAHNSITGGGFASGFGGGLSCAYEANTKIINSILWSNNAEFGPEISIGSNFDAADKLRAEVSVFYSDVEDGASGVFVDEAHGCKLNWADSNDPNSNLEGTTLTSPLLVRGYWGDYYLSQPTDQNITSPCVNRGSGLAIDNDMYRHTTRTDHVRLKGAAIDSGIVDMGYHYTLTAEILGDFNFDGVVDMNDFILFEQYWMDSGCTFPYFCHGRDITEDGEVDFEDFAAFAENWNMRETTPPKPDPMTWAVRPQSGGLNSITMTAATARDNSGSRIYYYFDCVSGSGHDCNWTTSPTYTDTGLTQGLQYGYRVKAKDEQGNETGWSVIGYAVPGQDDTPPQPNPMTWSQPPAATSSTSIHMTASTATDPCGPPEYYFIETTGHRGATNSNWQSSPVYVDSGLDPNTTYTYQVMARDKLGNQTQYSVPASATTLAAGQEPNVPTDTNAPTPNPSQWASVPQSINSGGPYWYHYMTAVTATDASPPVMYYFECVGGSGTSSGWITSPSYVAGPYLNENHAAYKVYTKDAYGNVSAASRIYHTFYGYLN